MTFMKIIQQWNDRHYIQSNIKLKVVTVDTLKKWNVERPTVLHDVKFLKLLLLDVFTIKGLRSSNSHTLNEGKTRFVQGLHFPH